MSVECTKECTIKTGLFIITGMINTQLQRLSASILISLLGVLACFPRYGSATPEYARPTGFECRQCHIDVIGGGPLPREGKTFLDDLKSKGLYRPLTMTQRVVRLIVGYLHMVAAIMWFGTIMYVHILLKPPTQQKDCRKENS